MAKYYAFRVMLSQPLELFEPQRTKRELLEMAIESIQKQYPLSINASGKLYLIYYYLEISEGIHALQIAREDTVQEPKIGAHGVTNQEDIIYPFSFFILDITRQIILIQEKVSAFREVDAIVSRVSDFFEKILAKQKITAAIEGISNADDVWQEIQQAQEIYSLVVDIDPPNFFGARFRSNIDIREAHEETNFTKFKLLLSNKFGSLRIPREEFQDLFQTIASGAGEFIVKLRDKAGNLTKIGNSSRPKVTDLPEEPREINPEELKEELRKIDELNTNSNSNLNPPNDNAPES